MKMKLSSVAIALAAFMPAWAHGIGLRVNNDVDREIAAARADQDKLAYDLHGRNLRRITPGSVRDDGCHPRNNPVCANGVTYQNTCLAISQGEAEPNIKNGPCRGDERSEFDSSGSKVSRADIMKFDDEGFRLVGKMKVHRTPGKFELRGNAPDLNSIGQVPPGQNKKITRATPDGLVYVTKDHKPKRKNVGDTSGRGGPPHTKPGSRKGNSGRKLISFWGSDTRSKIASTFTWPHWRLGELDWGTGEGGCSGTIVGHNLVLTAAHCVYDAPNKKWSVPDYFAPGRYRSSSGTKEPWGRWPVLHATVYTEWVNSGSYGWDDVKYDAAILTMGTNWAGNIGSYMGTLKLAAAPCTIDSDSEITGYPSDKANGEMWTSGKCDAWQYSCSSRIVYHRCDIWLGHSGSAIRDRYDRVFGVQSGAGSQWNCGYAFDSRSKDDLLNWGA